MTHPATAIPGLIHAVCDCVEEHMPATGPVGHVRPGLVYLLMSAEMMAEGILGLMRLTSIEAPSKAPQQIHAPLAEHPEPVVPRRSGPSLS